MKVILTSNMDNLGTIGDIVQVKNGYARNYLIPKGKALMASQKNRTELAHTQKVLAKKRAAYVANAQELADKLSELSLTFYKKVGTKDRIFGTVTTEEISSQLKELGFEVPRKSLKIQGEINTLGSYVVNVQLPQHVEAFLNITVLSDAPEQ